MLLLLLTCLFILRPHDMIWDGVLNNSLDPIFSTNSEGRCAQLMLLIMGSLDPLYRFINPFSNNKWYLILTFGHSTYRWGPFWLNVRDVFIWDIISLNISYKIRHIFIMIIIICESVFLIYSPLIIFILSLYLTFPTCYTITISVECAFVQ